jgi:hypothetical protein
MSLCGCGCGSDAGIYPRTHGALGIRKGEPRRFLPGHNSGGVVGSGEDLTRYLVEDRGYETPCHVWTGPKNRKGYALVKAGRSSRAAHRVIYEAAHGPLREGWEPDHLCRVRPCVRLDHLEVVPHPVNVRRGANQKLRFADVLAIRLAAATTGLTQVALADMFSVSRPTVRAVVTGRHWMTVTPKAYTFAA